MEIRGEPPLARLVAGVGWNEGIDDGPAGSLPTAGPLLYDDLATSPLATCPLLAAHGARCGAVVAIQDREGVRGYLGVHSRTPRAFTPDEADFLSVASQILGMAIRRKRNEEDLERTNRILDAVGRAQLEYISEAGGGRSFDRLVAELAAVSGCPRAFLAEAGPAAEGAPEPSLLAATDPSWAAQVLAAGEPVRTSLGSLPRRQLRFGV